MTAPKKREILSILEFKEQKIKQLALFDKVAMLANSLKLEDDKGKRFRRNLELVETGKSIAPTSTFFSSLFDAVVAIRVGNLAKAKLAIVKGISKSPYRIIFTFDRYKVGDPAQFSEFRSNIFKVINYVAGELKHDMLAKLLVSHVSIIDKSPEAKELISNLGAEWSLVEVRELTHSRIYDQNFLLIWLELLENRALKKEIQNYLDRQLSDSVVLDLGLDSLALVLNYDISERNLETMASVLSNNFKTKNLFEQFMIILSINNPVFKSKFKNVPDEYRGAIFQVYRKYFRKLLASGNSVEHSVFQLIKLGDVGTELIWWLL